MSALGQPPAPAAAPPAAAAPAQKPTHSVQQLHTFAQSAEKNLEQLATGLASHGSDPQAVKAVSSMADVLRRISAGLAKASPPPQPKRPTMDDAAAGMRQDMQSARGQQPPAGPPQ